MASETNSNDKNEAEDKKDITLSAALLAPLNAIFEAQVQAARAFLSFIFQMGFRHKYSNEDISHMDEPTRIKITEEINLEEQGKQRIKELELKKTNNTITKEETEELWNLRIKWDDLYFQKFDLMNQEGSPTSIFVPNLALLPIRPLSVDNANFKFELNVSSYWEDYNQMGTVEGAEKDRPWFLIKPKRIKGSFGKGSSEEKNIKVEVNVKTSEMPYGLDKLLTSLTNNISVTSNIDIQKD